MRYDDVHPLGSQRVQTRENFEKSVLKITIETTHALKIHTVCDVVSNLLHPHRPMLVSVAGKFSIGEIFQIITQTPFSVDHRKCER
jgi:hypothetical protein